jgi:hypothetical protein
MCLRSGGCSASDLESRRQWRVRAVPICTSCDLIEVTAPHGVRLQRLAARQLAGRTASARSGCIGSIDRAPSSAIDHHRNRPFPEPILHRATECIGFCEVRAAATTDPQRAALARMT